MATENCARCGNSFSYDTGWLATPPRNGGVFGFGRLCSVCAAVEDQEVFARETAKDRAAESDRLLHMAEDAKFDSMLRDSRLLEEQRELAQEQSEALQRIEDERYANEIKRIEREAELRREEQRNAERKAASDADLMLASSKELLAFGKLDEAFQLALKSEAIRGETSLSSLSLKMDIARQLGKQSLFKELVTTLEMRNDFEWTSKQPEKAVFAKAETQVMKAIRLLEGLGYDVKTLLNNKRSNWGKWQQHWDAEQKAAELAVAAKQKQVEEEAKRLVATKEREERFTIDLKNTEQRAKHLREALLDGARKREDLRRLSPAVPERRRLFGPIARQVCFGIAVLIAAAGVYYTISRPHFDDGYALQPRTESEPHVVSTAPKRRPLPKKPGLETVSSPSEKRPQHTVPEDSGSGSAGFLRYVQTEEAKLFLHRLRTLNNEDLLSAYLPKAPRSFIVDALNLDGDKVFRIAARGGECCKDWQGNDHSPQLFTVLSQAQVISQAVNAPLMGSSTGAPSDSGVTPTISIGSYLNKVRDKVHKEFSRPK